MAAGRLAPDAVVTQAVKPVLDQRDGYVLDGFPRNLAQTDGLDFDVVIYLDVPDAVVTQAAAGPRPRGRHRGRDRRAAEAVRRGHRAAGRRTTATGVLLSVDGDRPPDEITDELLQRLKNA